MKKEKLWLLIDSTHKKLLRARFWTTSLDSYKQDIEDAIKALEETLKRRSSRPRDCAQAPCARPATPWAGRRIGQAAAATAAGRDKKEEA